MRILFFVGLWSICLSYFSSCGGQSFDESRLVFTRADSLRGALRPERTCYDVTHYQLEVKVDPGKKFISGSVAISFLALQEFTRLQIDLFENMKIESIRYAGEDLSYTREYNAVFVDFPLVQKGTSGSFKVVYNGSPKEAPDAPWDGGFVWTTDRLRRPWVGVACQGVGASLWWPNKDHLSDEPDSMDILLTVPDSLMGVSNGQLVDTKRMDEWKQYHWKVSYPINSYGVSINVARYAHVKDTYEALDEEELPLDYYVLYYNRRRARPHFEQVKDVLRCYETYFGKYPFWEDGFALVESPYLGMEHQSGIAYGNRYMRGYLGGMIPEHMNWDYVIVHETGHEYFGNAVSAEDMAEIWLHESFTTYLESLFVECTYGLEEAVAYLKGQRSFLENREPMMGPKDVNWDQWTASDNYYKGALMLHSLRFQIGQDSVWFPLLRSFYEENRYQTITSSDFIQWVNTYTESEYRPFFNQYLLHPELPVLEQVLLEKPDGLVFKARFLSGEPDFNAKVYIQAGDYRGMVQVESRWQEFFIEGGTLENFRVEEEYGLFELRSP